MTTFCVTPFQLAQWLFLALSDETRDVQGGVAADVFVLPWGAGPTLGSAVCRSEHWGFSTLFLTGEAQLLSHCNWPEVVR